MTRALTLIALALTGYALAAELATPLPPIDLAAWGASVLVFGKVLELLVQFIKVRLSNWFKLPALAIHAINFTLGVGGALYIGHVGLLTDPTFGALAPPLGAILFGIVAAAIAAGWYDLDKKTGGKQPATYRPEVRDGPL